MICSDEFGPLGRTEARVLGFGGLPLEPVPHPLAGNRPDLVGAKAAAVAPGVLDALTGDPTALAERHRRRFVRLTERRLDRGAVCTDDACVLDPALEGLR